ncbi:MAG: hypothetical protein JNM57_01945 [Cyclobacteriaceae bacterium]|nr:hypothetical protein [Cyclobacteriaceae bacterium]
MKDELEDFIHQNREAFDDKEPSGGIWKGVESALSPETKLAWWNTVVVWRAAAMVFMVLSIYLLIPKGQASRESTLAMKEFKDVEAFYINEISNKVEMIDEFQRSEGLNGFTQDFQQLEAMYQVLKEEMKNRPSKEVRDALVLNLLVRIDLLNQQLQRLDKTFPTSDQKKDTSI